MSGRHSGEPPPGTVGLHDRPLADPVHDLLERHLTLCETAVHPLEIAVELEASGIGPGTAGRYRHADVFSLADELYARVPRRSAALRTPPPESPWRRRAVPALLVAVVCVLPCAALWLARATGGDRRGAGVELTVVVLLALAAAGTAGRSHPFPARFGYAAGMAAVLGVEAVGGVNPAMATALACSLGAADWCARWFRHIGWGHLGAARSRNEFRERMRPVLPVAVALYLTALSALTFGALALERRRVGGRGLDAAVVGADGRAWAVQVCTGTVLLLVLLLWRCDRRQDALAALLCGLAALGVAAALLRAAPPWRLAGPLTAGAGSAPAAPGFSSSLLWGFGVTAAVLLPYAWTVLLRPESHREAPTAGPATPVPPAFPHRTPRARQGTAQGRTAP